MGEARVVAGDAAFEKTLVSTSAWVPWYVAAELDGFPGDEIAVFRNEVVEVLDPADFRIKNRFRIVRFVPGQRVSILKGSSTLARINGRLLIVQQGGGYQPTEVRSLEGELVWAYRPDQSPPPAALRPADLDGDGTIEFLPMASTVERLDGAGRPVWSRDARPSLLILAPRTGIEPAWVVVTNTTARRRSGTRTETSWANSRSSANMIPSPSLIGPKGAVCYSGGMSCEWSRLTETISSTSARRTHCHLRPQRPVPREQRSTPVVVAGARPDVERWRLLIWGTSQDPVYDEVFDRLPGVFKARRGDGGYTFVPAGE